MKRRVLLVLVTGIALTTTPCRAVSGVAATFACPRVTAEMIRLACIGDSITFGSGIKTRVQDSYPAQLGRMLGAEWAVRNFGVSGATMLKAGDNPYWGQRAFREAIAFEPQVVVILLGTNDTKPQNRQHRDQFAEDYRAMIGRFAFLPSNPRIFVCRPAPAFPERWGIRDEIISKVVLPLVDRVAGQTGVEVIDLNTVLKGKSYLFPDTVHPDAEGAGLIAGAVHEALTGRKGQPDAKASDSAKVLIIGDSISIGYFPPTRQLLEGRAKVYHNPGNAAHTGTGLELLDMWLGDEKWDVIHFNHGLHDLKHLDEKGNSVPPAKGRHQIPIDQYGENLDRLVRRLKKTGARLIFATTTPVPEGAAWRIKGDSAKYNAVATKIMARHGVAINDLYRFAMARLVQIQRPANVHFTPEGSALLAEQVARAIDKALESR